MVNEIILTNHQEEKLDEIIDQILAGRQRIVLAGSAGVGKTTLVNFLLRDNPINEGIIYIAAPTHKALSVLKDKIDAHHVEFCTLHKGLQMRLVYDKTTGDKNFVQVLQNRGPFDGAGLLIVDESSMIDSRMLGYLKDLTFPIIFLGDQKQINPVKEEESPVFMQNWYTVTLTEIIRQGSGSPIIELSRNFKLIDSKEASLNENAEGYVFTADRAKIIHRLAAVNGTDELKYLAWTNAEVNIMNQSVRNYIYGKPNYIEQGEVLVLEARYPLGNKQELHNNFELLVENVRVMEDEFKIAKMNLTYKIYLINGRIKALHEDHLFLHKKNMRILKTKAAKGDISWNKVGDFDDQFLKFKYNHAITIHKSQGSTYKDAIINIEDVRRNKKVKEFQRLLYTAITRPKRKVILYNVK